MDEKMSANWQFVSIIYHILKTTASAIEAQRAVYLAAFYITQAKAVIHSITPDKAMMNERKILEYIKKEGSATRTDLHCHFHNNLSASELNRLLTALKNCDLIMPKANTNKRGDIFVLNS
jgi:predicted transcriptional regulator